MNEFGRINFISIDKILGLLKRGADTMIDIRMNHNTLEWEKGEKGCIIVMYY